MLFDTARPTYLMPFIEWAWTVSNRRPLVCKTRALPLSYTPVPRAALHARTPGRLPGESTGHEIPLNA